MLSKKELDFLGNKISILYRNGTLGFVDLLRSGLSCVVHLLHKRSKELTVSEAYFGIYENPQKTVCELFGCRQLGFGLLKNNTVSWLKFLIKRNKLSFSGNMYSLSFEVFIGHFTESIEKNGCLQKKIQRAFVEMCGDRLNFKYFFPNLSPENELKSFKKILDYTDTETILDSDIEMYHKHYLLSLKYSDTSLKMLSVKSLLKIISGDKTLFICDKMDCRIHKIREKNGSLEIYAELRSAAFSYIEQSNIEVYADINGSEKIPVEISESSGSYFKSYEKTTRFYYFVFAYPLSDAEISFNAKIGEGELTAECYSEKNTFFSSCLTAYGYKTENCLITIKNGKLCIEQNDPNYKISEFLKKEGLDSNSLKIREASEKLSLDRIWLYSDYSSVKTDNGYFQFIHDILKKDGIKRYYITHSTEELPDDYKENIVLFGSEKHIELFLAAEKIFASFVDAPNSIFPFDEDKFRAYSDLFHAEIIYLQHGVLHAHIPWRYSPVSETFHADKIVVSSEFEIENFTKTYKFPLDFLIPTGMPRYDRIPNGRKANRILFAPSWRAYIDEEEIRELVQTWGDFLNSEELSEFLENYDLYLDFKLHPMFEKYSDVLHLKYDRVRTADNVKPEEYLIFITDFSSYVFDFVYLKTPIIYFFPDYKEFIGGKYQYRQLDIKFEKAFGMLCTVSEEAVKEIKRIAENNFLSEVIYRKRMEQFFLPFDDCSEKLYQYTRDSGK